MEELESTQLPFDELFFLAVNYNNIKYEFLIRFSSNNKNLICLGSGAYSLKENISPPIFRRHSWQNEFDESVIYYNDPTLYNDPNLLLGWGVGKNDEWYLHNIAEIIRILANKNHIKSKNMLFFGSSGGGFTAIMLATLIKKSAVLVNNPQLFLINYLKAPFNKMIDSCFDNMDLDNILKKYKYRFEVIELFKREKYMPQITYIVNVNSENDILNQVIPFINSLSSFEHFNDQLSKYGSPLSKVNLLLYQDGRGHGRIFSTRETINMIKKHFNKNAELSSKNQIHLLKKILYTKPERESIVKSEDTKYKISIIIPIFNVEEYLREALESIVRQTIGFECLEVIMVNDCSTDNSAKIMEEYASRYKNVIAINLQENSGAAGKPRNIGMDRATSDYLMFLDPDDYYVDDACEILYNKIIKEKADIVFGKYSVHYENGDIFTPPYKLYSNDFSELKDIKSEKELFYGVPPSLWTKIFKKRLIEKNRITFPERIPGQDLVFVVNTFLKSNKVFFVNKEILYYRKRITENKSISYNRTLNYLTGLIEAYKFTWEIYKYNDKEKDFAFIIKGNLLFWIKQLILSDLTTDEKIKALNSSFIVFKKYNDLGLVPPNHFIPLFDSVLNKQFSDAVLITEGLFDLIKDQEIPKIANSKNNPIKKSNSNIIHVKDKYNALISIVVPVFNVEDYIEDALESIVRQTIGFEKLEVIMVNDNSTDNSGKIMEKYSNQYKNFISIHLTENSGAAGKPRNIGMTKASSEYIMFLDPDDYYADNACEILYNKIIKEKADIVFGTFTIKDENGCKFVPSYALKEKKNEIRASTIDDHENFLSAPPSLWTKIFKKRLIEKNRITFPEGIPAQDSVFVLNSFLKAKGIVFINKIILHYNNIRNEEKKSITHDRNKKTLNGRIQAYCLMYDLCKKNGKEEYFILLILKDKLVYWINQLLLSNLTNFEKKESMNLIWPLFKKFEESNLNPPSHLKELFDLIFTKKFDEAVLLSEKLSNSKKDQLKKQSQYNKFKQYREKIFIICDKVPIQLGGLGKVVLHRSQIFAKNGYDVSIITVREKQGPHNDYEFVENELRKNGELYDSVDIINIYNYYKTKNSAEINLDYLNITRKTSKIHEKDYQIIDEYKTKRIVRYFHEGKYFKKKKWGFSGSIESIEYFDDNGIRIKRKEFLNGFLSSIIFYQSFDKIRQKRYFTKDGFCYLTKIMDIQGQIKELILFDRYNNNVLSFNNIVEFHKYFITELCENSDKKPYLICEGSAPTPKISNIDQEIAYLISALHVNPYTGPYTLGSPMRNIGILEEIENLDALIVLTESQKRDIKEEFGDYNNVYVIPHFVQETIETNLNKNFNTISIFSRIAWEKNLSDAIKAFRIVVDKRKSAKLNIFGRATLPGEIRELKKLKKIIKDLKLEDNVFIRGYVSNVHKEMSESVATLLTSKSEGFGLVLLESMLNSTPVISYDLNYGPSEVIDHKINGFLAEYNNIEQIAEFIIELLDDPEKAKKMGAAAREKVLNHYTEEVIIPQWEKIFDTVPDMRKTKIKNKISKKTTFEKEEIPTKITKIESKKQNLPEIITVENKKFTQKLVSKCYPLYILLSRKNNGIKNVLINIKGYRSIKRNGLLDKNYYLNKNEDVRLSGMDPILHYMYFGFKEGRNPNPSFDCQLYLKANEDVSKSNLNPLVHYSLYGKTEGRKLPKS